MKPNPVYLDYAAATPVHPEVLAAMMPFFADQFANPSAVYIAGQAAHQALEQARSLIAQHMAVKSQEIIFTAGGTESVNMAIHGVMSAFPGKQLLVSAIEHEAVLAPAKQYDSRVIPVRSDGILDLDALQSNINQDTVLISCMYANNEIGTVQPLRQISALIKHERQNRKTNGNPTPLYLHTDASQAGAYLGFELSRLGVDLLTLNGGKMYGPKQTGCLYVRRGTTLQPLIVGGGQERGLRSGTEHVAGAVGLAAAFDRAQQRRVTESDRQRELRDVLYRGLQTIRPDLTINGSIKHRLPNNLHITIPGIDGETVLMQLDEAGVMVATGSACSAQNDEPSHVLLAMGLSVADANASLRFTLGEPTTQDDIDRVIAAIKPLIKK